MPTNPPVFKAPGSRTETQRKADIDRMRPSAVRRGYGRDWQRFRDQVVMERGCKCEICGGLVCLRKSEQTAKIKVANVDHLKTISEAPDSRLDRSNVRVLCVSCHSARTARDQGFGVSGPRGGLHP